MSRSARLITTGAIWAIAALAAGIGSELALHASWWAWWLQVPYFLALGTAVGLVVVAPMWGWVQRSPRKEAQQ